MSKTETIQLVNIKQYDKQLKIDNQILVNNQITNTQSSSFLIEDHLSIDATNKLNILQENVNKTYLSTICESLNQKIVDTDTFVDDTYEIKKLNGHFSVAIPKQDLDLKHEYFVNTGIDYIFSPFHILYNHMTTHGANTNSLNILVLNNIIYALILDENKKIAQGAIKSLTPFYEVQQSQFNSDDNLEGQKIFDEVHYLEMEKNITTIISDFYEHNNQDNFCESVTIFYTINHLTPDQLKTLKESIMLEIEYSQINFNDYMFYLADNIRASKISFSHVRHKKENKTFPKSIIWIILVLVLIAGGSLFYIKEKEKEEKIKQEKIKQEQQAKLLAKKKKEKLSIKLPNHRIENEKIFQLVTNIFNSIPNNAILSELQLQEKDSTFVCNLLTEETYTNDIKLKLLKIYKNSDILLMQGKKPNLNAIIANSGLLPIKIDINEEQPNYRKKKFVVKNTLIEQVKAFLPKDAKVTFVSKSKKKYLTYNFNVKTILQKPQDFFDFMNKINRKSYSIQVFYPLEFVQTNKGLEVSFKIKFNQFFKKRKHK